MGSTFQHSGDIRKLSGARAGMIQHAKTLRADRNYSFSCFFGNR
jgi:hypothetical protein